MCVYASVHVCVGMHTWITEWNLYHKIESAFVHTHTHTHVRVHIHTWSASVTCLRMYKLLVQTYIYIYIHTCIHTHLHVHIHTPFLPLLRPTIWPVHLPPQRLSTCRLDWTCAYVMCVCVCVTFTQKCMYTKTHVYIHTYTHTYVCVYIYIYIYIYIYTYTYTYIHTFMHFPYLTTFTPCKCPLYVCMHAFRRMSHIFRLVSSEPDAKNAPKGWKSTARQSLRCPTRVRIVFAWSRSHSLMVPLVDPATTTSSWWMMRYARSEPLLCCCVRCFKPFFSYAYKIGHTCACRFLFVDESSYLWVECHAFHGGSMPCKTHQSIWFTESPDIDASVLPSRCENLTTMVVPFTLVTNLSMVLKITVLSSWNWKTYLAWFSAQADTTYIAGMSRKLLCIFPTKFQLIFFLVPTLGGRNDDMQHWSTDFTFTVWEWYSRNLNGRRPDIVLDPVTPCRMKFQRARKSQKIS